MKYLKTFEYYEPDKYINNEDIITINIYDILHYLDVEIDENLDEDHPPKSKYDVDIVEFLKEILLNENISFKSVNTPEQNPMKSGIVKDVKLFAYKDELYVEVKINNDWIIIDNSSSFIVYYNAENKTLHQEVKMKKKAEKYNL